MTNEDEDMLGKLQTAVKEAADIVRQTNPDLANTMLLLAGYAVGVAYRMNRELHKAK